MSCTRSIAVALSLVGLAPGARAQVLLHLFEGEAPGDARCGVVRAGDVDGDGKADVLVCTVLDDTAAGRDVGSVKLFSGADGSVLWHVDGTRPGARFGTTVVAADLDGDGALEIAVGSPLAGVAGPKAGRIEVYQYPATTPSLARDGVSGERLGDVLELTGDLDGDGGRDLVVGWPRFENAGGARLGRARALSGATLGVLWSRSGPTADTAFGDAVTGVDDLTGDGIEDVVVGALDGDRAHLLSGANGAIVHTWTGDSGSCFGTWVTDAGDADGDGVRDVGIGAHCDDTVNGQETGSVTLISGATRNALRVHFGTWPFGYFGDSLAGAGDVDGDGHDDLVVGAWGDGSAGVDAGRAVVYSGATGAVLLQVFGPRPGDELGVPVAGLGDVDGDGRDDVGVGACFYDRAVSYANLNGSKGDQGAVFVFGR